MISVTTAVVCNGCGDWLEIGGRQSQTRKIRQEARAEGWLCAIRTPDGTLEDYCPDCQEQPEAQ